MAASHGFACHRFSYPTVRGSMAATLEQLTRYVERIDADRIHFIGHSLGGVVVCRFFERQRCDRAGRVVLLGSPLVESRSARAVARFGFLKRVIGPLVADEFLNPHEPRTWNGANELGVIAGTRPMGLGRFFARFDEDSDGTVGVSETKLPGHRAHLTLPVSHMGMLASPTVARHVGAFLEKGSFL